MMRVSFSMYIVSLMSVSFLVILQELQRLDFAVLSSEFAVLLSLLELLFVVLFATPSVPFAVSVVLLPPNLLPSADYCLQQRQLELQFDIAELLAQAP